MTTCNKNERRVKKPRNLCDVINGWSLNRKNMKLRKNKKKRERIWRQTQTQKIKQKKRRKRKK